VRPSRVGTLRRPRNAVNGEEEAPNQPTPVNLPPDVDGTVVVPRYLLSLGCESFNELEVAVGLEAGEFRSLSFSPLLVNSQSQASTSTSSRQRQLRGSLAACPRFPHAPLGTTIECHDSESNPFYPVRVEHDDEARSKGA
jgi:hypothetical protein